jgi:hypothetical protein
MPSSERTRAAECEDKGETRVRTANDVSDVFGSRCRQRVEDERAGRIPHINSVLREMMEMYIETEGRIASLG